jgi:hypothetical protein
MSKRQAVEMTGHGKRGKPGFPFASHSPWKSLRDSTFPRPGLDYLSSKSNPKKGTLAAGRFHPAFRLILR